MHSSHPRQITLVRLQLNISWHTFIGPGLEMLLMLDVAFIYTCLLLPFCIQGLPPKYWHLFVQYWPQALQALLGHPETGPHSTQVNAVLLGLGFLVLQGIVYWKAYQSIQAFRALCAAARQRSEQAFSALVRRLLRISPPEWMRVQVIYDPSPTTILDQLQDVEGSRESWMEELAAMTGPVQPSVRILLRLSDEVTVILIGQDGKQQAIPIKNKHWAAILAFLATRSKGEYVHRDLLLRHVYGAAGPDEKHRFEVDRSRLKATINEEAERAGLLDPTCANNESPEEIDLLENDAATDPLWRLAPQCEVDLYGELESWYERVIASKPEGENNEPLSREALWRGCLQIMQSYGDGYLASYQDAFLIWSWAEEIALAYREKCWTVLQYALEREWAYARDQQFPLQERREAVRHNAKLAGWSVLVMSGLFPDTVRAEQALNLCLKRYRSLKDIAAAQSLFQTYVQRMKDKDVVWEPKEELLSIWPEATAPKTSSRRSKKSTSSKE